MTFSRIARNPASLWLLAGLWLFAGLVVSTAASAQSTAPTTVPPPPPPPVPPPMGMTWTHLISNAVHGTVTVGCNSSVPPPNGCNANSGDTVCTAARPMLCIYKPTPAFSKPPGVVSVQYNTWSGGLVATTAPVSIATPGLTNRTLTEANNYCVNTFGPGWRWAEFHDGWGWNFQAYGGTFSTPPTPVDRPPTPLVASDRFWVRINDKPANCWN